MFHHVYCAFILFASSWTTSRTPDVLAKDWDSDIATYFSRPDLRAPRLTVQFDRRAKNASGYYLLSPWTENPSHPMQNGPYIYDSNGSLVWTGAARFGGGSMHGLHACDYGPIGAQHLCFFQGDYFNMAGEGRALIMDSSYSVVEEVHAEGERPSLDMHEFALSTWSSRSTAIFTVYQTTVFDPCQKTSTCDETQGWIRDTGFQEVELSTGRVLVDWYSLDHIDPSESWFDSSDVARHTYEPWDYLHINSIDKDPISGHYIISGRHTSTIYMISRDNGTVLWRLGGEASDFSLLNFELSAQHHVKVCGNSSDGDKLYLSVFMNGRESAPATTSYAGVIEIHHSQGTAKLTKKFLPQHEGSWVETQGSIEILHQGGTALVNWGDRGTITEHDLDSGEIVFNATFPRSAVSNYRASKIPYSAWDGKPGGRPAVWIYSPSINATSLTMFVSWNGATEIKRWSIKAEPPGSSKTLETVGVAKKNGFETMIAFESSAKIFTVEAIDKDDKVLGASIATPKFIPSNRLARYCTVDGCPAFRFDRSLAEDAALALPSFRAAAFGIQAALA